MHRFQGEAKMCLHSFFPSLLFVCWVWDDALCVGCKQQEWLLGIGIVAAILLAYGAYVREWRRWLQALAWDAMQTRHVIEVV